MDVIALLREHDPVGQCRKQTSGFKKGEPAYPQTRKITEVKIFFTPAHFRETSFGQTLNIPSV
jgi:hypothetical protein